MAGETVRERGSSREWRLSPDDLEPTLAAEVKARLNALMTGSESTASQSRPATEAERHVLRRVEVWANASLRTGGTSWWIPVAGLVVLIVLFRLYPSPVELFALIAGMIAWTIFVTLQERRRRALRLPERLPAELLADVAALTAESRAERLYVIALQKLADPRGAVEGDAARRGLTYLNDLLASSRMLEAQRVEVLKALAGQSRGELESEARRLRDRLGRTENPDARAALTEALALCAERQERAKRLEGLRERVEAQQEVAHQALLLSLPAEIQAAGERVAEQARGIEQTIRQEVAVHSQ